MVSRRSRSAPVRSRIDRKSFANATGRTASMLRPVLAVDAHVFGAEIAAPDRGARAASAPERYVHAHIRRLQMLRCRRCRIIVWKPVLEEQHAADVHGRAIGVEPRTGSPRGTQDAPPIR